MCKQRIANCRSPKLTVVLLSLASCCTESEVCAQNSSDILKSVAVASKSNLDSIKTWSGVYEGEEAFALSKIELPSPDEAIETSDAPNKSKRKVLQGKFIVRTKVRVQFAIDATKQSYYCNYRVIGQPTYESTTQGPTAWSADYIDQPTTVITPEHVLQFYSNRLISSPYGFESVPRELGVGRPLTRDTPGNISQLSNVVVPLRFYALPPPDSRYYYERQLEYANYLSGGEKAAFSVSPTSLGAPKYVFTTRYSNGNVGPDEKELLTTETVSEEVGYNTVSFTESRPGQEPFYTVDVSYEQTGNVFLPNAYRLSRRDIQDGSFLFSREWKLVDSQLNKDLMEGQFSFLALGVTDKDRLIDRIQNTLSVFDRGEPIPVGEYARRGIPGKYQLGTMFKYFAVVLAVVLGVSVLFRGFSRMRRSKSASQ